MVLREVASVLVRRCGKQATVARHGGEEFAVVISGTEVERSLELAEELRLAVSTAQCAKAVTASGFVSARKPVQGFDSVDVLHLDS